MTNSLNIQAQARINFRHKELRSNQFIIEPNTLHQAVDWSVDQHAI